MAVFTTGTSYAIDMTSFDPTQTLFGISASGTSTQHQVRDNSGTFANFYGSGLASFNGDLDAGTINRIDSYIANARYFNISGLAVTVDRLLDYADAGDVAGARAYLLSGNDFIYGAGGNDVLHGYAGNDSIYAYQGNDTLYGGFGNDLLSGGLGIDKMYGGTGNDVFYISRAEDSIIEYANQGTDKLISSATYTLATNVSVQILTADVNAGAINLTGNNYENVLNGNAANNRLAGGAAADDLFGGSGNDTLHGGTGIDLLAGDEGADYFTFSSRFDSNAPVSGSDIIDDFFRGEGDRIDVSGIDASSRLDGNQKFSFIGSLGFSGDGFGAELRVVRYADYSEVSADIDGDGKADFGIEVDGTLNNNPILRDTDFFL